MHEVDDVHCLVVDTGNFGQNFLIVRHYFLEFQCFTGQYGNTFYHDSTGIFATSAVDGKQQGFCKVGTCPEKLYLLADSLIGYTTCDTIVVAVTYFAHQVIIFVLDGAGIYGYLCTEFLEAFREFWSPKYGQVRFGRRTEVIQCLQEAEGSLRYLHTPVVETSANGFCYPSRVSSKDIVI